MNKYNFAVIFDMDGVMIDNRRYHKRAWFQFEKKYNLRVSESQKKKHVYGRTNDDIFEYFFKKRLPKSENKRLSEEKETIYRKSYAKHVKPVKGLIKFLDEIKKNKVKTAIATSAGVKNVNFVLGKTKTRKYFSIIVDERDVTRGKPDPQVYIKTAKKLKVKPKDCIVFEDALSGVESALRAKMKVVAITTGNTKKELSHAHYVINDFTQINLDKLDKILRK